MTGPTSREPPGSYGLPVLGTLFDTAEFFLLGWERFFRVRQQRHRSTVFKVNLFKPTVAVLDRTGIVPLFGDANLIQDYGFSWAKPPLDLVGAVVPSVFLHGTAHDRPKEFFLSLIRADLPSLQQAFADVTPTFLRRWVDQNPFSWADEIERYAISVLFEWVLGAKPDVDKVRYIYNNLFLHKIPQIERLIPWSSYSRSVKYYPGLVDFIRAAPRFQQIAERARAFGISGETLPHRLAFLLGMNAYLGVQNLLKSIVGELSREEAVLAQLREALRGLGEAETIELPLLDNVIREVLRLHPPVFFIFGRCVGARTITTSSGVFDLHDGDLLMGVIPFSQRDPAIFADPERFDPRRYDEPDGRRGLIWPRGFHDGEVLASDRSCPGKDPALILAKLFTAALVSHYEWQLAAPPQWSPKTYGLNVAAPVGKITVEKFKAAE